MSSGDKTHEDVREKSMFAPLKTWEEIDKITEELDGSPFKYMYFIHHNYENIIIESYEQAKALLESNQVHIARSQKCHLVYYSGYGGVIGEWSALTEKWIKAHHPHWHTIALSDKKLDPSIFREKWKNGSVVSVDFKFNQGGEGYVFRRHMQKKTSIACGKKKHIIKAKGKTRVVCPYRHKPSLINVDS